MRALRSVLAMGLAFSLCVMAGCSSQSMAADTGTTTIGSGAEIGSDRVGAVTVSEPERFSSVSGYIVTPPPTETPEPTQTPEPTKEPAAYSSTVEMLNLEGNFMEPKSLDGIDPYNDKVVALTFDDGPNPNTTPQLLDILKDNDVNATFFTVGENVASYPEIVKRAYEEGNEIGTHSWNHEKNFLKWSQSEVMDQISRTNDAIEEATGLRTIIDRPPEGAINEEVASGIGRMQILWDVDPVDWKQENRDPDIVYDNVVNNDDLHDGSIVLSHDIRPTTVEAYDRIIKELKEEGYKFVTVTQLIQIAQLRGKDLKYVFNGSYSAAKAAENGISAENPYDPAAEESSEA